MSRANGLEIDHLKVEKPRSVAFRIALLRDTSTCGDTQLLQQNPWWINKEWRVEMGTLQTGSMRDNLL